MMEYHKLIPCFRTIIFAFLYLALSAKQAHSYAIGAPVDSCTTLTPVHGYAPQGSTSPFSITPQFRNYGPSTSMQVNLTATGNKSFKGFMVQARIVGTTTPVGIFSDTSSVGQRIDCSGSFANTLTHINNNPKTLVTVAWTAPSTADGAVIEFVGTFVEKADTYWTYVRSFTLTDACFPSPCQNGATCFRAGTEGYLCNCENGYSGTTCADQPPCADEVATCGTNYKQCYLNGGNGPNSFVCECLDGSYSFDEACPDTPTEPPTTLAPTTMTTEMDPCRTGPCQNNGVCMKLGPTTYECDCHTIYTGPQCQYTVGCASFPCQNNGVCTSTGIYGQEYDCSCSVLYSGTNCEIEVDPCASSPCMNGGFCNRRGDLAGYACTCYNGYTGIRCETSPPPTTMPPPTTPPQSTTTLPPTTPPVDLTTLGAGECNPTCLNGGSCVEDRCECVSGFTGPRCEQDGRPFFTNCPEGETVTYVLDQGSNLASLDFDPITATNFNGENLEVTFIVGPDLNTVSSLEFSEDYQEGQIVVAQAVDPQNGARNCSFIIRLQDNQTPEITCPDDINEISTSSSRQVTWPDAEVNDNADPSLVVTYLPSRGSMFDATGESVSVIARATDSSSNYKECIFTVTVHMREYDCEPFPAIENAEVSCDNDASGRECQVTCNDGFVKTIANSIRYTCIADNAASFWDPTPSDICARAQVGNGISKTTIISFSLTSLLCPAQTTSFKSSIATNITNTLDTYNLCSLGSASACEPDSVNTECTTNTGRGKRSIVLSRRRRDTSALLVDINVSSAVGSGSDQDMIEGDIDQIVDGIVDVANNEAFVLTVNGEAISNVQSGTRAPTEFQWSCDTGMVSSSSGCVPCQPGTYYDETVNLCVFCSRGYYQDQTRQTSCQPCPGDQLTDATGSVLADCYDPSGFQLTQTQWILIYIGGGLAGAFIILLFITLIICCCRSNEETPKKGKDATDNLTYLNRAFEDDSFNNEMHYTNTLSRNGSTMPMNGQRNGHVTGGDNRLIEIPSDPAVLYAEVPVTSFNAKGYNDFNNGSLRNGHANGHVNSVSASIDMDTIPRPPSLGAPPPPPPPPPADTKPQRIPTEDDDDNDVLPPPPSNNHHFNSMHADSAPPGPPPPPPKVPAGPPTPPKVSGVPPPPAPPSTAGAAAPPPPPPPPLPSVNSNNNSYTSSPTGSTASRRSDGRARFLL